jgi:hypothetical protein
VERRGSYHADKDGSWQHGTAESRRRALVELHAHGQYIMVASSVDCTGFMKILTMDERGRFA